MEMTDSEILRKYRQAETPYERRQQERILAELNDVPLAEMKKHILKLISDDAIRTIESAPVVVGPIQAVPVSEAAAQDQNKAAGFTDAIPRRPLPGLNDKTELNKYIIDAVRVRMEDVGNMVESYEREIAQLKETHAEYLEEWGALKEWLTANE